MKTTLHRIYRALLIPVFLFSMASFSEASEKAPLVLGQGEQRLLHVPGLIRYALGSPIVRGIQPGTGPAFRENPGILLKGVAPGNTDLWVWKQDGSSEHRLIQVERIASSELSAALAKALSHLEEAEILFSGSGVVLRGEIRSLQESARIAALTSGFPRQIEDQTHPSDDLLNKGQQLLKTALARNTAFLKLRTERIGEDLWVRGSVETPQEQLSAERQIQVVFPAAKVEILALPDAAPTVHFKVFLLELKKNRFGSLGLSWPAAQDGAFQITTAGITDQLALDTTLKAMEGDGTARILSKPELVVRAPGEAELFAGGEFPLQSHNRFYSNVIWKNYGLTLRLHVTHSTQEQVRVDVFTEVSHLDPSTAMEEIPGIQANRMKTQVDARYGVPLFLSGLLQQGTRENARGLPWIRKVPILGLLFGSEDYLKERSELVAILLPNLTPPPAPLQRMGEIVRADLLPAPKGPVPAPRNWLSPSEIRAMKRSPSYPWNAFEGKTE